MKTKLQSLFIGLALLAGVHQTTAQVTNLGIASAPGNQSVLYWPAGSPANNNYLLLQSATNLAAPNWVTVNDAVPVMAASVSNTSPAEFFRLIATNPPAGMVLIPAGWFTMGDSVDTAYNINFPPPTNIYVSAFYMDVNLVTYQLWQTVYNAATNIGGYSFVHAGAGKGPNYPVETVDWYDCVKWCNARSQQAGLTPVYYTDAGLTQVYKTGETDNVYVNWLANGYRLPTAAEWEKAARGGLSGRRFPWGNLISESQANYLGDTNDYNYDRGPNGNPIWGAPLPLPYTSPVGSFDVNGYGLYDMVGNVDEWCWNWWGNGLYPYPYGLPTPINPTGGAGGAGDQRDIRGGSWNELVGDLRLGGDGSVDPTSADGTIGFRCVRGH